MELTVEVTQLGNITNNATLTALNEHDTNVTNDQANETVNSQPAADIEIIKAVDNPNPNVGENITFTLRAINNGPNNATGLKIADGLSSAFTYVSNTSSHGTYNSTTGVWRIDTLVVGAVATLNITVTVTQSRFITNIAELIAADLFDPNSRPNNQKSGEDDQDNSIIFSTPLPVPALTPAGLIALLSVLSAVAVLSIKVRKRR